MASESFQPLRGMSDLRAPEIFLWQHLEQAGRRVLETYGFSEVRTPLLESTDLFVRAVGDDTDIVQKEMYRFADQGGRDIALRPEGTAGVIRVVAGAGQELQSGRVYYIGPMFRYEKPQAGRKRQLHQLGAEALGDPSAAADVECIAMQLQILKAWGLEGCQLEINSLGEPADRAAILEGIREHLRPVREELCEACRRKFDTNVLRIFDCKSARCAEIAGVIPPPSTWMSESSRAYLDEVQDLLQMLDLDVSLQPRLVRGLDYYVHTVWEIRHGSLGAQDALCGGGRYRFTFGKKVIDGVGFAMGLERVCMALQAGGLDPLTLKPAAQVYVVTQHPSAFRENLVLTQTLRLRGVSCGMDLRGRAFNKQLREADKAGVRWVIIRGEQEMEEGTFLLKNMEDGTQEPLGMPELLQTLTHQLRLQ